MKRGFLKTQKYRRAIGETDASVTKVARAHASGAKEESKTEADQDVEMTTIVEDGSAVSGSYAESKDTNGKRKKKKKKGKKKAVNVDMDDHPVGDDGSEFKDATKSKGKQKALPSDDTLDPEESKPSDPKEKVVNDDMDHARKRDKSLLGGRAVGIIPPRPLPPRRPGWGRRPEEDLFHTVPERYGGPQKKRAIFRYWPRDPDGKPFSPDDATTQGTLSPDGYPWGETLYDIFEVRRLPKAEQYISFVTGSTIRKAMQAFGELDAAASEIIWAKSEGEPRIEGAADTEELIKCTDFSLQFLQFFTPTKKDNETMGGVEYDDDKLPADIPPPLVIPVTSPFHPSHYPKPFPLTPFEFGDLSILLQERIPMHLLPKKLYVHDPFCLLPAVERQFRDTAWTSRPDIVRTYNLQLSESVRSQAEETRQKAEELEEFKARTLVVLRYKRTEEQVKNFEPEIEVPLPPYVRRPTRIEESHMYISPVAKVGKGHHSLVYKAEWELPRNLFVKERICPLCFQQSVDQEIQTMKDTGTWDKLVKASGWGPEGYTEYKPTQAELGEVSDPVKLERDGEALERVLICIIPPKTAPEQVVEWLDDMKAWDAFIMMNQKVRRTQELNFIPEGEEKSAEDSHAPRIRIDPPLSKSCPHGVAKGPVPRTAKFTVVAKLSVEDDDHLPKEAINYQAFPEHLFHHYNGYIILDQIRTIVPIHAVVPQFYGYYTPDNDKEVEQGQTPYLSPILLLEHCGEPIDPDQLSHEDQEECASLLLRFQRAGWLHESVAPRNFLVQYGQPTEFPSTRRLNPETSFRLIDFGRSRKYKRREEKRAEEVGALRMFSKLHMQMSVTTWMGQFATRSDSGS